MTKACTGCGEVKSLPAFHKNGTRNGVTLYRPVCKVCIAESARARAKAFREAEPERVRETARRFRERHREQERQRHRLYREHVGRVARIRAAQRRYNARNRTARNAASQRWRDANGAHLAAYYQEAAQHRKGYQREWRRTNPERIRAYRETQALNAAPGVDYLTRWRMVHADQAA